MGKYILDFYCPTERLAIELDGAQHYGAAGMKRDAERTAYLNSYGIEVLRFPNEAVFLREEEVLREIRGRFHPRPPVEDDPSLAGGELGVPC